MNVLLIIFATAFALYLIISKMVVLNEKIPSGYVGVLKQNAIFLKRNQAFPGIAMNKDEFGIIPEVYVAEEQVFKVPKWQYDLVLYPVVVVPDGEIGLVVAKHGKSKQQGSNLSLSVDCNGFSDARTFLNSGGEMGAQSDYINEGEHKINLEIFKVITSQTPSAEREGLSPDDFKSIFIDANQIGIVTTEDGKPLVEQQIAGEKIDGHNKFTNATLFIRNGGYRGLQEEIIPSGSWLINPWFAKVKLEKLIIIPADKVGVIISSFGKTSNNSSEIENIVSRNLEQSSPYYYTAIKKLFDQEERTEEVYQKIQNLIDETQHAKDFEKLKSFLVEKGYKGVQRDILDTGKYQINTEIYSIATVPTNQIILEWHDRPKSIDNWDYELKSLSIVSKDRHKLKLEVRHTFRIPKHNAPIMILTIGPEKVDAATNAKSTAIKNLVTKVFSSTIANEFLAAAAAHNGIDFIDESRSEIQTAINARIQSALKFHGVHGIETTFDVVEFPKELEKFFELAKSAEFEKEQLKQEKELFEIRKDAAKEKIKVEYTEKKAKEQEELELEKISGQLQLLKVENEFDRKLKGTEIGAKIHTLIMEQKKIESKHELEIFLKKLHAEGGPEAKIMMRIAENFYKWKTVPDVQIGNLQDTGANYYGTPTNTLLRAIMGKLGDKLNFGELGSGNEDVDDTLGEAISDSEDEDKKKTKKKLKKDNDISQENIAVIDLITDYKYDEYKDNIDKLNEDIILPIAQAINDSAIQIIELREGSLILTLELSKASAENLFVLAKMDLLDIKMIDVRFSKMENLNCSEVLTMIGLDKTNLGSFKKCLKSIILKKDGIDNIYVELSKSLKESSPLFNSIINLNKRWSLTNEQNVKGISKPNDYRRDMCSIVSSFCTLIDEITQEDVMLLEA